jgi:hypothetical protein
MWSRAYIKFFLQGKTPKDNHAILTETLAELAPPCATVTKWVIQFKRATASTQNTTVFLPYKQKFIHKYHQKRKLIPEQQKAIPTR